MYAYIKDGKIQIISQTPINETVVDSEIINGELTIVENPNPVLDGMEKREYENDITDPALVDYEIVQRVDVYKLATEKHQRIYQSIVSAESLDDVDLEGEIFTDFEIGEIITDRVFGGNPHAEKALTNKVLAVALALIQGAEMNVGMSAKIVEATVKKGEVDAVRNLFNIGNL